MNTKIYFFNALYIEYCKTVYSRKRLFQYALKTYVELASSPGLTFFPFRYCIVSVVLLWFFKFNQQKRKEKRARVVRLRI